jgi:SAM-dependent methyltransferase
MSLDVVDLRNFYASPLGQVARRLVGRMARAQWEDHAGLRVLGVGYATPYLVDFQERAQRVLAFMPAAQGVVHWPPVGRSASALEEIWRILAPGGRVIIVVPSRSGLWARVDTTPFGHGHPYSRGQLQDLLQETLFLPVFWGEALYVPPFGRASLLRSAPAFERIAGRFSLPGAGVHVVEATKQLYRPASLRRAVRRAVQPIEVLAPAAGVGAG